MYCIFASRHRSVPFLLSYAFFAAAACRGQGLDKRLIEYGWDVPFVQDVRDRLPEMETKPFDGVVFKLKSGGMALQPVPLDPEAYKQDLEALRGIEWNRFTDSFIVLWSASNQDWFDDKDWSVICENIRLFAKAAREGGCAGLCFDPEPYGDNPWAYSETLHRQSKSFQEYQDVVRSRGVQFMTALNEEMPDCVLLFLFQLSVFRNDILSASQEERREKLSFHHYGLMPAFLNGLLEAAGEGITFVDGNESAYYYTDEADYFEAYHRVRQRGRLLIDRGLWPVYCRRVQMGQALYVDQYFGLRDKTVLGDRMTPQEQKDWFEHNAYWALYSSDRYVWCYSERMNWWTGQGVPAGAEQSLRSAALKIKNGEELGFDLDPVIELAQLREMAEMASKLNRRQAKIHRVPEVATAPQIDGHLEDHVWKLSQPLERFVPLASLGLNEVAKTTAWATYDANRLYVGILCDEPDPKSMYIVGEERDDDIWIGDEVEILISLPKRPETFFHFIVNPHGVYWDSIHRVKDDKSFDPPWEQAALLGPNGWSAEMAIPWSVLQIESPQPGTRLRANLCRQRGESKEQSCWSPMADSFLEPELFGTWILQ